MSELLKSMRVAHGAAMILAATLLGYLVATTRTPPHAAALREAKAAYAVVERVSETELQDRMQRVADTVSAHALESIINAVRTAATKVGMTMTTIGPSSVSIPIRGGDPLTPLSSLPSRARLELNMVSSLLHGSGPPILYLPEPGTWNVEDYLPDACRQVEAQLADGKPGTNTLERIELRISGNATPTGRLEAVLYFEPSRSRAPADDVTAVIPGPLYSSIPLYGCGWGDYLQELAERLQVADVLHVRRATTFDEDLRRDIVFISAELPELHRYWGDVRDRDAAQIETYLLEKEPSRAEGLSVLGTPVARDAVTWAGPGAFVVLFIYMIILARRIRGALAVMPDRSAIANWIGVFPERFAGAVTYASIGAPAMLTCALLVQRPLVPLGARLAGGLSVAFVSIWFIAEVVMTRRLLGASRWRLPGVQRLDEYRRRKRGFDNLPKPH